MHREDGQKQSIHICGPMPSKQLMIAGITHQPMNKIHPQCQDSVQQQDKKKAGKWSDRTRVGINLGYSSKHALNVSLILNLQAGLVSPQYHCIYDDLFETTTGTQSRSIV